MRGVLFVTEGVYNKSVDTLEPLQGVVGYLRCVGDISHRAYAVAEYRKSAVNYLERLDMQLCVAGARFENEFITRLDYPQVELRHARIWIFAKTIWHAVA